MGPLLQRWSRELESGIVSNAMFDLVPGEDQLFANTILLRLADAFRGGNTQIRFSVVRVFLIERKHRDNRKHNQCKGLLSMGRVANHVELLKRVKSVFNSGGDSESNALALVLFGCWAEFANSNAQIRYLILSSLVSPHDNEVRLMSSSVATCSCS
jgi:integrator complex subunit 7